MVAFWRLGDSRAWATLPLVTCRSSGRHQCYRSSRTFANCSKPKLNPSDAGANPCSIGDSRSGGSGGVGEVSRFFELVSQQEEVSPGLAARWIQPFGPRLGAKRSGLKWRVCAMAGGAKKTARSAGQRLSGLGQSAEWSACWYLRLSAKWNGRHQESQVRAICRSTG